MSDETVKAAAERAARELAGKLLEGAWIPEDSLEWLCLVRGFERGWAEGRAPLLALLRAADTALAAIWPHCWDDQVTGETKWELTLVELRRIHGRLRVALADPDPAPHGEEPAP